VKPEQVHAIEQRAAEVAREVVRQRLARLDVASTDPELLKLTRQITQTRKENCKCQTN
jgi:hypothetical protein